MDDISIERIVFHVPGLDPAQAQDIARHVANGLAASTMGCGNFGTLVVELNERATCGNLPRLAEAIVQSLQDQIG